MINCNYTESTSYNFYNKCCINDDKINVLGVFSEKKIERALSFLDDASNKWTEFFIPEIVDIPIQKPDMEGILEIHSCISIISQRVVKTPVVIGVEVGETISNAECTNLTGRKLVIEGLLKQKVIYTADEPQQSLHSANFVFPFSTFIIIDKETPLSQKFRITPYIEDIYACMLSERSVFKNTTIFIKASKVC